MPGEERVSFEKALETDASLQAELEAWQPVFQGFRALQVEALASEMKSWGDSASSGYEAEERIERYLAGEMSEEEQKSFEQEMEDNKLLAQDVRQHRELLQGFRSLRADSLAEEMRSWKKETESRSKPKGRIVFMRRLAAAAAILLLLVFAGGKWYAGRLFGDSALTDVHFKEVFLVENTLSGEAQSAELPEALLTLQAAQDAFESEDYAMAGEKYRQAAEELKRGAEGVDPAIARDYAHLAEWNAVLAGLFAGDSEEQTRIRALRITQNTEHTYRVEAFMLLEKMDHPLWGLR